LIGIKRKELFYFINLLYLQVQIIVYFDRINNVYFLYVELKKDLKQLEEIKKYLENDRIAKRQCHEIDMIDALYNG
jgi:excinuclease UvrABC helicase subunit UvrB